MSVALLPWQAHREWLYERVYVTRWRELSQAGLFGLIDGLNGMVGLVIGLSRVHAVTAVIFTALLARAGSSAVSMAGAQYESSDLPGLIAKPRVALSEEEAARFRETFADKAEREPLLVLVPRRETPPDASARVRWLRIAAMGGGYLASALLPGLGFAVSLRAGWALFVPATVAVLASVTWFRSGTVGWRKATVTTLVIFGLAVGAGLLASLAG